MSLLHVPHVGTTSMPLVELDTGSRFISFSRSRECTAEAIVSSIANIDNQETRCWCRWQEIVAKCEPENKSCTCESEISVPQKIRITLVGPTIGNEWPREREECCIQLSRHHSQPTPPLYAVTQPDEALGAQSDF